MLNRFNYMYSQKLNMNPTKPKFKRQIIKWGEYMHRLRQRLNISNVQLY